MEKKKIIVIGAGASGLMAAIAAAENGASVSVLEAQERPGKKLLLTGNGKCNLTHLPEPGNEQNFFSCYRSSSPDILGDMTGQLFATFGVTETLSFFRSLGLATINKNGYIYPRSLKSVSVLEVLLLQAERLGVKIRCATPVEEVRPGWDVQVPGWTYHADAVIFAGGSPAGIRWSKKEPLFLLQDLGLKEVPLMSSLTGLGLSGDSLGASAGDRTSGRVTVWPADTEDTAAEEQSDSGELQWTENGISGIAVFNISRFVSQWLREGRRVFLRADLLEDYTKQEIEEIFRKLFDRQPDRTERVLTGFFPPKTAHLLMLRAGLAAPGGKKQKAEKISAVSPALAAKKLAEACKNLTFEAVSVRSLESAQVSAGGVSLQEVDPATLECLRFPDLYLCGEILDVDGECGGYNLQWAWTSGHAAGLAAALK